MKSDLELGKIALNEGNNEKALKLFKKVLLHNKNPKIYFNLGVAQYRCGLKKEAKETYLKLIKDNALLYDAFTYLGEMSLQEKQIQESIEYFQKSIDIKPTIHAYKQMGFALLENWLDLERAIKCFQYIEENSSNPEEIAVAKSNIGNAFNKLERPNEAIPYFIDALKLHPKYPICFYNLATSYNKLKQYDSAIKYFQESLKIEDYPYSHIDLGMIYFLLGDYKTGSTHYEWRFKVPGGETCFDIPNIIPKNLEDLKGKAFLFYSEQGLGDSIQFIRYAKLLKEKYEVGRLIVVTQPPLVSLFRNTKYIDECCAFGEQHTKYYYRCVSMSLPHYFGIVPTEMPYLTVQDSKIQSWKEKLSNISGKKIGIYWRGNPRPEVAGCSFTDRKRSINLSQLEPLFSIPGISWISLQKDHYDNEIENYPNIINFMGEVTDFQDTGALIKNLDLIIGVDSSVAHLASGLNVPTWILSRWDGCWRWGETGEHTHWYSSLKIYRQSEKFNWSPIIETLTNDLDNFMK